MTKKRPDWVFLKLEMPAKLWQDFDAALKMSGMTRSKALVVRQMLQDLVDEVAARMKKKAAATLTK